MEIIFKMEHLNEYRLFKIRPFDGNVKDKDEPFFDSQKQSYKMKNRIFGSKDWINIKRIDLSLNKINELINIPNISKKLNAIFRTIKILVVYYNRCMNRQSKSEKIPNNYIVYRNISNEDCKKLMELGFGIYIYDDSVIKKIDPDYIHFEEIPELFNSVISENLDNKYKISWNYIQTGRVFNHNDPYGEEDWNEY